MKTTFLPYIVLLISCLSVLSSNEGQQDTANLIYSDLSDNRLLAQSERQSIRITPIFYMDWATEDVRSKIQDQLVPAAISYFETTLKVDRERNLIKPSSTLLWRNCSLYTSPRLLIQGASADLVIIITNLDEASSTSADSFSCIFNQKTNRPLVGVMRYNSYLDWSGMDETTYEADLYTTMHEITHILGFSNNLYADFINPSTGKRLENAVIEKTINGIQTTILSLEPLTARLRKYFDCPSLEGAYLENQGDSGSINSHFERRIFYNEFMTATRMEDRRLSEFSLALLEGSGWYTPDYSMAEPLQWGKGKGCAFLNEKCVDSSQKARFGEFFCDNREKKGCSFSGRSIAYCGDYSMSSNWLLESEFNYFGDNYEVRDSYADNCPYYSSAAGISCEELENEQYKSIEAESVGPGSMCMTGSLRKEGEYSSSSGQFYCIKQTCKELLPSYFSLGLEIGGSTYYCTDGGFVTIEGYKGHLYCPSSVDEYCSAKMSRYCKRGCMGRGTCKNGECICNEGYGGLGCSLITGPIPKVTDVKTEVPSEDESEQESEEDESDDIPVKTPTENDYYSKSYNNNPDQTPNIGLLLCSAFIAALIIYFGKLCCGKPQMNQQPAQSSYHTVSNQPPSIVNYHNQMLVQGVPAGLQPQQNYQQIEESSAANINSSSQEEVYG